MSGYMIWFETELRNWYFGPRAHWPLYMGGGAWDPYGVCQPIYFAWFVFYIGNDHFWTGDLKKFSLTSPPIECFPLTYNLNGFKSRINRHLLTLGSF